jgi:hypothetical protein
VVLDGIYDGAFHISIVADPLGTGFPLEETCTGTVRFTIDDEADPQVIADAECYLPDDSDVVTALLDGFAGPFAGSTEGALTGDGGAGGEVSVDIGEPVGVLAASWTGTFGEDLEGTATFGGEYEGIVEGLVIEFGGAELPPFDIEYEGGFDTLRTADLPTSDTGLDSGGGTVD